VGEVIQPCAVESKHVKRKPDEGRYSKVSRRIWGSGDFRELSAPKPSAQWLWLRLLTGPELGCIPGLFEAWEGGLASALRWSVRDFRRCWEEIESRKMAAADWTAGLIWVPNAIHHNFPENPNTVKGWKLAWKELPDCALKLRAAKALLHVFALRDLEAPVRNGATWVEAFHHATGNVYRNVPNDVAEDVRTQVEGNVTPNRGGNQDQEQEQEQEDPPNPPPRSEPARPRPPDRMAASFVAVRDDVRRLHERWQRATGLTGHRLRGGATDIDATLLAEALDLHGEADCVLVADACMRDRMVNGEADERGEKHRSIRYIFGNEQTFARILEAAQDMPATAPRSADDEFEAAMEAQR